MCGGGRKERGCGDAAVRRGGRGRGHGHRHGVFIHEGLGDESLLSAPELKPQAAADDDPIEHHKLVHSPPFHHHHLHQVPACKNNSKSKHCADLVATIMRRDNRDGDHVAHGGLGRGHRYDIEVVARRPDKDKNESVVNIVGGRFRCWKVMSSPEICRSGGSGVTDSSIEELNFSTYHHQQATSMPPQPQPPFVLVKKRFRKKFSQEQMDKMLEFAAKLGWRIPREDDTEI
ncbi:hypothetical protein FXO38_18070 [Capsicum annuum]|nr:hypothetical protein FXO38_18070 [Capsicum annuum]KAF3676508.1 hypothetical protein FXO37_05294 [Capsicum annuum]